jgi:hypothetical protein
MELYSVSDGSIKEKRPDPFPLTKIKSQLKLETTTDGMPTSSAAAHASGTASAAARSAPHARSQAASASNSSSRRSTASAA